MVELEDDEFLNRVHRILSGLTLEIESKIGDVLPKGQLKR